jgi:hypothetical protein
MNKTKELENLLKEIIGTNNNKLNSEYIKNHIDNINNEKIRLSNLKHKIYSYVDILKNILSIVILIYIDEINDESHSLVLDLKSYIYNLKQFHDNKTKNLIENLEKFIKNIKNNTFEKQSFEKTIKNLKKQLIESELETENYRDNLRFQINEKNKCLTDLETYKNNLVICNEKTIQLDNYIKKFNLNEEQFQEEKIRLQNQIKSLQEKLEKISKQEKLEKISKQEKLEKISKQEKLEKISKQEIENIQNNIDKILKNLIFITKNIHKKIENINITTKPQLISLKSTYINTFKFILDKDIKEIKEIIERTNVSRDKVLKIINLVFKKVIVQYIIFINTYLKNTNKNQLPVIYMNIINRFNTKTIELLQNKSLFHPELDILIQEHKIIKELISILIEDIKKPDINPSIIESKIVSIVSLVDKINNLYTLRGGYKRYKNQTRKHKNKFIKKKNKTRKHKNKFIKKKNKTRKHKNTFIKKKNKTRKHKNTLNN